MTTAGFTGTITAFSGTNQAAAAPTRPVNATTTSAGGSVHCGPHAALNTAYERQMMIQLDSAPAVSFVDVPYICMMSSYV